MGLKFLMLGAVGALAMASSANAQVIPNGNFSAGQTGFTSSYTSVAYASGTLIPEGTYTVGPNPQLVNSNWIAQSGSNNLLLINGSTNPNQKFVYTSNAATLAAGLYNFSLDVANVCCNGSFTGPNAPSTLTFQYSLNSGTSFQDFTPPTYTTSSNLSNSGLQFTTLNFAFSNPTSVTNQFEVKITNGTDAASGNDFALDNLAVTAAPEPGTWLLMLGGVAFLGYALRAFRRRESEGLTA